jgi:hypothetical protein
MPQVVKYLPTILALLVMLAGAVADPVSGFVAEHPTLALVLTQVVAIINHFVRSPLPPKAKQPEVDL